MFHPTFENHLKTLERQSLYRSRQINAGPQGIHVDVDGRRLVNFCSNDYLGLANHPAVVKALQLGADRYGVGSGSAHLITGHCSAHHALEEELAAFTGFARVLLFSTGYMANLGVISALLGKGDRVLQDRLNHASLLDGGLLSGAQFKRYPHADLTALAEILSQGREARQLVVSDGVFSMDGDLADVPGLSRLCESRDAGLLVDDAHGLGVLGHHGRGVLEHFKLGPGSVSVLVGTLGKAFGTFGAFVAGSDQLIEYLIQRARTYIYTTAIPPSLAEATRVSLDLAQRESWRREKLSLLVQRFRGRALERDLPILESRTPIQPVLLGESRRAIEIADRLRRKGILVMPIRPPTVPEGSARLRVTFSALHEETQIDWLVEEISDALTNS
ncbi:MAG: 8-amino-7-oxononanoate synthase [Methylococcaceae bacterium]|nr:8-amino-7-oxononanoate synthase [Methylococcaceae bacterium]